MKKETVLLKITSSEGHSEISLLPTAAIAKIKAMESEENKWLFLDNEHKKAEYITEDDLLSADEIMLVTGLAGGCAPSKPVAIDIEMVKGETGIVVNFVEDDFHKEIKIKVGGKQIYDLLRNRETIVAAIEKKFNDLAIGQVDDLKKVLNV